MTKPNLIERLKHFEKHQLEIGDEYGAEVLHAAIAEIETLRSSIHRPQRSETNDHTRAQITGEVCYCPRCFK
jgi:hypothetical protein